MTRSEKAHILKGTVLSSTTLYSTRTAGYSIEEIAEEYDLIVKEVKEAAEWDKNHPEEILNDN